jgi:ribosome-associated toxin RatA of RatAB toxin-antitoxin module
MLHASRRACQRFGASIRVNIGTPIRIGVIAFAWCFAVAATADAVQDQETEIQIKKSGETLIVDVNLSVPASPHETWDVLTDYDHMAQFLPNLQFSKIIEAAGNKILVSQKGQVTYGPLSFSFDSVREVVLTPYSEIRSQVISGSIKQASGTTRLLPDGEETRIVHHSESVPGIWVPPLIGKKIIASEIRQQYGEMRKEIMRRKAAAPQH